MIESCNRIRGDRTNWLTSLAFRGIMKYYTRQKRWVAGSTERLVVFTASRCSRKSRVDRAPLTRQRRRQLSCSMAEMLGTISAYHASIYCLGRVAVGFIEEHARYMDLHYLTCNGLVEGLWQSARWKWSVLASSSNAAFDLQA